MNSRRVTCLISGFILLLAMFACPFVTQAQDGQAKWLKATIEAPAMGQATFSEHMPALTEERQRQLESCLDRTHLYPWTMVQEARGASIGSSQAPVGSPSVIVEPQKEGEIGDPGDFNFRIIHQLTSNEAGPYRSNVMEPSTAFNNRHGIITGNWFAASSRTETSFKYMDPWGSWPMYPPRTGYSYCCDQEVIFDPVTQCFFWSILYVSNSNTGGYLRIAVSRDPASGQWWAYDFDAESDGANDTTLPDYPHLALSRNNLYVTWNEFANNSFTQVYLLRVPTLPMSMMKSLTYWWFATNEVFTLKVASDYNHHSTMYAVSNYAPNFPSIRVYEWSEGSGYIYYHDITGLPYWSWSGYDCKDPDGYNPCGRLDDRVMASVATYNTQFPEDCKNQLWVAWTAAQDNNYLYPYVYVARICIDDWSVINTFSNIYNTSNAFAYPAFAANGRGDIGVTLDVLGGNYYNVLGVIPIDKYQPNNYGAGYFLYWVATGDSSPTDNRWGDYNGCNAWYPNMYQWVGSGHVRFSNTGSTGFYVRFCRVQDNDPGVLPCDCDLNGDGRCDMSDWLLFGTAWGRTDCPITNDR